MPRTLTPSRPQAGMDSLAAELNRRGLPAFERLCRKMIRDAWPYRGTDRRAMIVVRANVRTLRDLRILDEARS